MPTSYLLLDMPFDASAEAVIAKLLKAMDAIDPSGEGFVEDGHQETPTQTMTRFLNEDEDMAITLCEDKTARLRYLEVQAESDAALKQALACLRKHLATVEHGAIVNAITKAKNDETLPENIFYQLAYSAPGWPEAATEALLLHALASADPKTREGAATAVGVLGWEHLKTPLLKALARERDEQVREAMERAKRIFV